MAKHGDKRDIGLLIDTRMTEKGISSKEMAEKYGVTPQTVNNWRNGKITNNADLLKRVSSDLDLSINEILAGEQQAIDDKAEKRINAKISTLTFNTATSIAIVIGAMMVFVAIYVSCTINLLFSDYAMPSLGYIFWVLVSLFCVGGGIFLMFWGLHVAKKNESRQD